VLEGMGSPRGSSRAHVLGIPPKTVDREEESWATNEKKVRGFFLLGFGGREEPSSPSKKGESKGGGVDLLHGRTVNLLARVYEQNGTVRTWGISIAASSV